MENLAIRQFKNALNQFINEQALPIEVKALVVNGIARDLQLEADKACVEEYNAEQAKLADKEEHNGKES